MKIAILGTRGVPNFHGGFEQFAEFLSEFLVKQGHDVYVYNSSSHPYREKVWRGVRILHQWDPENKMGTAGQFIYDLNCILNSRKHDFDIILQLGYTSSSIWGRLMPKKSVVVTNMDGLEWKRSKYSKYVQHFLKIAEKLAVRTSDFLISDSIGIKNYIQEKYKKDSEFIAYGANIFQNADQDILEEYKVIPGQYNMLIARLEPENNIECILDGIIKSYKKTKFLVIGKHETKYGEYLKEKYRDYSEIFFLGGIYNLNHLNNLRYFSKMYFHGHSVGGTNPSLLEAMASGALIAANDNIFNKSILGEDAFYFNDPEDISEIIKIDKKNHLSKIKANFRKIECNYSWSIINKAYESYLIDCHQKFNKRGEY